ncbi:mitochondrial ATP synthase 6 kDa subunit [Hordeum vulgare]|nr:mitochondrial ATP synthase 6 kDa subunit [Hordeum vulgare]
MKFFSAFDPWPVFFCREWGRTWPFLAGFATTGVIITKITDGFTEEDLKNSKFVQAHKSSRSEFAGRASWSGPFVHGRPFDSPSHQQKQITYASSHLLLEEAPPR